MELSLSQIITGVTLQLSGSKSETNRLLILQSLYPTITIANASDSDDSRLLAQALKKKQGVINIHHAGTAMRFLTAYFATQNTVQVELTGSKRMKERPIQILVEALQKLGADISYKENKGYPPLLIQGKEITKQYVELPANVSSQYISALMLIAPSLPNGLTIFLKGELTSAPYVQMSATLLRSVGISVVFENQKISIEPKKEVPPQQITVESDWSSASYWFSFIALSHIGTTVKLLNFRKESLQGDRVLVEIYRSLGVESHFESNALILTKNNHAPKHLEYDFRNCPDIAQTVAVSCLGLGMSCHFTGLHTLKIKETDRLEALKNEISKFGVTISVTDQEMRLSSLKKLPKGVSIETYNDHRMAMAFTPLMLKTNLKVLDSEVVTKSYPNFWKDVEKATKKKERNI